MPLGSGVAIKSKVNIIKNALLKKKKKKNKKYVIGKIIFNQTLKRLSTFNQNETLYIFL